MVTKLIPFDYSFIEMGIDTFTYDCYGNELIDTLPVTAWATK